MTACTSHHGDQGVNVMRHQAIFDDEINVSGGHTGISHGIEAEPGQAACDANPLERVMFLAGEQMRIGGRQSRVADRRAPARRYLAAIALGTAIDRDKTFAKRWQVDHPGDMASLLEQSNQHSPACQAANEGPGAVDRVEAPAIPGIGTDHPEFLSPYAMIGIAFLDRRAQDPLRRAVGLGDRIEAACSLVVAYKATIQLGRDRAPGGKGKLREKLPVHMLL